MHKTNTFITVTGFFITVIGTILSAVTQNQAIKIPAFVACILAILAGIYAVIHFHGKDRSTQILFGIGTFVALCAGGYLIIHLSTDRHTNLEGQVAISKISVAESTIANPQSADARIYFQIEGESESNCSLEHP